MRRAGTLLTCTLLAALAGHPVAGATAPAPASDPTPERALTELNEWRAQAGVPPVAEMVPRFNEWCHLHNRYSELNGTFGHAEDPALPGYTVEGSWAGASSVLMAGEPFLPPRLRTPRGFDGAVWHRMAILEPRLRRSGFDATDRRLCLWTTDAVAGVGATRDDTAAARSRGLQLFPWPGVGATGVPTTFDVPEFPDPHVDAGDPGPLGYLISVGVNGAWGAAMPRSVLRAAELVADGAGAPVPLARVDDRSPHGRYLRGGFGLFPLEALTPSTWYTARADGVVEGAADDGARVEYPFAVSWRFATGAGPEAIGSAEGLPIEPGPSAEPLEAGAPRPASGAAGTVVAGRAPGPEPPMVATLAAEETGNGSAERLTSGHSARATRTTP